MTLSNKQLIAVVEDDFYYIIALTAACILAFDLGLVIGWLMTL
jgi:hypothetical protein